jgi:hypothetical protein
VAIEREYARIAARGDADGFDGWIRAGEALPVAMASLCPVPPEPATPRDAV